MTEELAKTYDPKSVEAAVSKAWLDAGAFDADPNDPRPSYCIVIPPPNVTAPLHLGHALNNTLQDILIRHKRMCQHNTLWMPGTDHAGIATQTVVEKRILAEEGKRRTDFDRDEFIARVQSWKDEYEACIIGQLRSMGCSCDWRRTRFTMDDVCARAVRAAFFQLFCDGLIYRGKRLVNWDPATQTVLADDEVEHEEVKGHFWYMRYPLVAPVEAGGETIEHVTVATTRPETMLGDTAVAVNPRDPRAEVLVGRSVRLPLVGRIIPIVADDHVVLPDPDSEDEKARFSTGFLKVTPAHDPDDYAIGERHLDEIHAALIARNDIDAAAGEAGKWQVVFVNVMAPDGSISDRHGWYDACGSDAEFLLGMDRFEARQAVVEWFRTEGLLEDIRDYTHQVGHSYRSHVPIEPYLSDQWYVAVNKPIAHLIETMGGGAIDDTDVARNSLAGLALQPLVDERLTFTPDRYARTYQLWLANLRDWPISRQLWWGHRIPVWSRKGPKIPDGMVDDIRKAGFSSNSVLAEKLGAPRLNDEQRKHARQQVRADDDGHGIVYTCIAPGHPDIEQIHEDAGFQRDPDVLDTWFSSALWPFSTMGWPEQTPELRKYYPGDVLCTAREIITLWVTRMVMMGQYCVGDIPFTDVFIHAMIQDGEGRKMSKSLGNGIDPLDIIDSHGSDAMRFTLCSMTTQTQDTRMPVEEMTLPDGRKANTSPKFDIGRNFCNKLWNASRFALMNLDATPAWSQIHATASLADAWILSRLNRTVHAATAALAAFRFNELADTLYHFVWDELCDWYLEIAKSRINAGQSGPKAILAHCLDVTLRLLHPVAPFITEAIWSRLNAVVGVRGPGDMPAEPQLVTAHWPRADAAASNPAAEAHFALLTDLIRQVRNVRTHYNVPPRRAVDARIEAPAAIAQVLTDNVDLLQTLAGLGQVTVHREPIQPDASAAAVTAGDVKMYILDIIDRDAEIARLTKQRETLHRGITAIERKLASDGFIAKAPATIVQRERDRLASLQAELSAVEQSLAALSPES